MSSITTSAPPQAARGMSLAARAALAVALLVGFYVLALGIAGGLLWIPYAEIVYAGRLHPKLALICVGLAGLILWSILPRFDRFDPPGPRLTPEEQPALFEHLSGVARATSQAMPAEVYLIPDVNAWVSQRGGVMGIGSRRVMGVGLPLMQALSVPEFRAVLAHEFGHYHGGDTALGPWIYATRAAMARTLETLGERAAAIRGIFTAYANLFLRLTHAISRRQEYTADALAAHVAGAGSLRTALRKIHGVSGAFSSFWGGELEPALQAGYHPPLAAGFARFLAHSEISRRVEDDIREAECSEDSSPYDTHPCLRDRLAALPDEPVGATDDAPAVSLLRDVPALEQRLLAGLRDAELRPVDWDSVPEVVLVPAWRRLAKRNRAILGQVTAGQLPAAMTRVAQSDADEFHGAVTTFGAAMTVALLDRGWTLDAAVGNPVSVTSPAGERLLPFHVVAELASGSMTAPAWVERSRELGIVDVRLAPPT